MVRDWEQKVDEFRVCAPRWFENTWSKYVKTTVAIWKTKLALEEPWSSWEINYKWWIFKGNMSLPESTKHHGSHGRVTNHCVGLLCKEATVNDSAAPYSFKP